jgi:hypothetical protein
MNEMKTRYRLTCRGIRGGMFYCVDKTTGKRTSLKTTSPDEAQQMVEAKNQAERQPMLNLQISKSPRRIWQAQTMGLPRAHGRTRWTAS